MAIYSEHDTDRIYQVGQRLLRKCLLEDGSLIHNDKVVWSLANLELLHKDFTEAPDTGDRSFLEKFKDQVKPGGPTLCRIAAEVVAVYLLFPSNVGSRRKNELVNEILGWAGEMLAPEHDLALTFAHGIGSGGQGYNTRRPFEISFLLSVFIAWKRLPHDRQLELSGDAWLFMDFVDGIEDAESRQARHMLLHILFPDVFERIASRQHKRQVVSVFASVLESAEESTDRALLAIRRKLEILLERKDLDFYWRPLREVWYEDADSDEDVAPMEALRHKKQVVLFGPPGTGKTYRAKQIADRLIRAALLKTLGSGNYFALVRSHEEPPDVKNRTHRLQLHPALGYEDFVRGLVINDAGATEYRLGYLPRLVAKMSQDHPDIPHVLILDEINRTDLSRMLGECFSLLEDRTEGIDLLGIEEDSRPFNLKIPANLYIIGTMNLIDQSVEQLDFALRRRFLWISCPFDKAAFLAAAEHRWKKLGHRHDWQRVSDDFSRLADGAASLNREIARSSQLGSRYEVGHTYLLDTVQFLVDDLGSRPQTFLWTRSGAAKKPVHDIWNLSLKPLISEYLAGLDASTRIAEVERLQEVFLNPPSRDE